MKFRRDPRISTRLARILPAVGWALAFLSFSCTLEALEAPPSATAPAAETASAPALPSLTRADQEFLDDLERRGVQFFLDQADPQTGLVADRAPADGSQRPRLASIAATGFGLTALCIADHRGWISRAEAQRRVELTLRCLRDRLYENHGFYYHFVDGRTGQRAGTAELSSIDTALLMAGVLTAKQYFPDSDVSPIAGELFDRIDWPWMLNGGDTLSMGWKPEQGFIAQRWSQFNEHLLLTLMAMGSTTHPLPARVWDAWRREPVVTYAGLTFLQGQSLFVHQYPEAWIDFRGKADAYADYWQNSVLATRAHRRFCIDLAHRVPADPRFSHYDADLWGFTASDSAVGYHAWGGPYKNGRINPLIDGTIVPSAAGGSLPFAPRECLDTLRFMHDHYGDRVYGKYGFVDAFNPDGSWTDTQVLGIDVGITVLMAENLRSGFVWDTFMRNPEIRRALDAAGFQPHVMSPDANRSLLKAPSHSFNNSEARENLRQNEH